MHLKSPRFWKRIRSSDTAKPSEDLRGPPETNPWAYPVFPPNPPEELLARADKYNAVLARRRYLTPVGDDDTPLCAIYRLYEHLVLNRNIGLRNELERFWYNRWPIASIPDPGEQGSPSRYAVLACIPALMVTSFNQRVEIGLPRYAEAIRSNEQIEEDRNAPKVYEAVPEWCAKVPPLEKTLVIPHEEGEVLAGFDDPRASRELKEKNILHWQPHIHFV